MYTIFSGTMASMDDTCSLVMSDYSGFLDDDDSVIDDHESLATRSLYDGLPSCSSSGSLHQRHGSVPVETYYGKDYPKHFSGDHLRTSSLAFHHGSTERLFSVRKPGGASRKVSNSMSYMSKLSSSFLSIASSVTDSYISATSRRRPSIFTNNASSQSHPPLTDAAPTFVIPKRSTPPRTERMTSKAELMYFLKNSDPKGYHAAIVFDMSEEKLNSNEELYRKKIREKIAPIDFVEVSDTARSERISSIIEFWNNCERKSKKQITMSSHRSCYIRTNFVLIFFLLRHQTRTQILKLKRPK